MTFIKVNHSLIATCFIPICLCITLDAKNEHVL